MRKVWELTGQVFGTIKVLSFAGKDKGKKNTWNCICIQCKKKYIKQSGELKRTNCKSCSAKKHGYSMLSLYHVWASMKARCINKNSKDYNNYGGRGITIYNEWENFNSFKEWALLSGYKQGLEIDRIDVNGNYCPENCRWVSKRKQANNRRNNNYFEIDGETKTLFEWVRIYEINYSTVIKRLKSGLNIEDALKMEVDKTKQAKSKIKYFNINGISKSLYDWCEVYEISIKTIKKRMKKGMSLAEALGVTNGNE